tara:strand:- start:14690 stop:15784 length:1095 start_codon:yes stop_codon:yes gene_type:complete
MIKANKEVNSIFCHTENIKSVLSDTWPEDGLQILNMCPVCGRAQRKVLHKDLSDQIFFCAPGKWVMFQCLQCDSGYLDPRPNEETIHLAYKTYFTHESNALEEKPTLIKLIRKALGNGYRNWKFGTSYKPSTFFGIAVVWLMKDIHKTIDSEMRNLRKPKQGDKILDFGCGNGEFLSDAKAAGWETYGIDFDKEAVTVARSKGLNVIQGGFTELEALDENFNVITLSHVIEHVHEPVRLIELCYEKLTQDGQLWIETPNLNSQGHGIYGRHWRDLDPPRHLTLFTTESLTQLLSNAGFTNVKIEIEHPAIDMVFNASNAIQSGEKSLNNLLGHKSLPNKKWRKLKKNASKEYKIREFITISAYK